MFLMEKLPSETPRDVEAFLESLIRKVYGKRPEWLEYELRESHRFQGREFMRMFCNAGSVHSHLTRRAATGEGISRDILLLGTRIQVDTGENWPSARLIHLGQESVHDPNEVQRVGVDNAAAGAD
jgi:hypothetical protein